MRKINTNPYKVTVRAENGEVKEVDYGVKDSMVGILFQPSIKLSPVELLKQNKLAEKVLAAESELLLEEEEYTRVKTALEAVQGLSRNDVEFVERILNAEEVTVTEAQKD